MIGDSVLPIVNHVNDALTALPPVSDTLQQVPFE